MKIIDFTAEHIEEASTLAIKNYTEACSFVPALPIIKPDNIQNLGENNLGVAALKNGSMVGYLCAWGAFDNPFGCNPGVKGIWSPVHGNAATGDKAYVYKKMYQAAAEKWVKTGALSHAVTLYAHEETVTNAFFNYGFGLRRMEAVKIIKPCKNNRSSPENIIYSEIKKEESGKILELNNGLIHHLKSSPCFMSYPDTDPEKIINEAKKNNVRYFIAQHKNRIIAYIKIMEESESFASRAPDMSNICGAYLLPEYRGNKIYDTLLDYTESILYNEGYKHLGVDFESFNPNAYGFWRKHFTVYTNSVVRRIDAQ